MTANIVGKMDSRKRREKIANKTSFDADKTLTTSCSHDHWHYIVVVVSHGLSLEPIQLRRNLKIIEKEIPLKENLQ